jgi:c-di-GMP-binding flagellar brake protein YcgR
MDMSANSKTEEARTEARKLLRCQATVLLKNAPSLKTRTIDVSLSGISLMAPENIVPGKLCGIAFEAAVNGKIRQVNAVGKVVYSICVGTSGFRIGLQFTDIDAPSRAALGQILV